MFQGKVNPRGLTLPNLAKKWAAREVPGGDRDLMVCRLGALGTISIRAVRLLVTSTSYGRSHSGKPASCGRSRVTDRKSTHSGKPASCGRSKVTDRRRTASFDSQVDVGRASSELEVESAVTVAVGGLGEGRTHGHQDLVRPHPQRQGRLLRHCTQCDQHSWKEGASKANATCTDGKKGQQNPTRNPCSTIGKTLGLRYPVLLLPLCWVRPSPSKILPLLWCESGLSLGLTGPGVKKPAA